MKIQYIIMYDFILFKVQFLQMVLIFGWVYVVLVFFGFFKGLKEIFWELVFNLNKQIDDFFVID